MRGFLHYCLLGVCQGLLAQAQSVAWADASAVTAADGFDHATLVENALEIPSQAADIVTPQVNIC
ncbi:MAG: hypothetical protein Tsb002_07270 [Wenzhouxiangellaceae bacterium]